MALDHIMAEFKRYMDELKETPPETIGIYKKEDIEYLHSINKDRELLGGFTEPE